MTIAISDSVNSIVEKHIRENLHSQEICTQSLRKVLMDLVARVAAKNPGLVIDEISLGQRANELKAKTNEYLTHAWDNVFNGAGSLLSVTGKGGSNQEVVSCILIDYDQIIEGFAVYHILDETREGEPWVSLHRKVVDDVSREMDILGVEDYIHRKQHSAVITSEENGFAM